MDELNYPMVVYIIVFSIYELFVYALQEYLNLKKDLIDFWMGWEKIWSWTKNSCSELLTFGNDKRKSKLFVVGKFNNTDLVDFEKFY